MTNSMSFDQCLSAIRTAVETERAACELEAQRLVPYEPIDPRRSGDYLRGRREAALEIRNAIAARRAKP